MPRLAAITAALDAWFDPAWAEPWDAVGLVCGDPQQAVARIVVAVDPVPAVVEDAITAGAQLVLTHHPLLLTPVHSVSADDPKGALVHRLIQAGTALFVAHTNADVADPGVSDALADRLGVTSTSPLDPSYDRDRAKLVVFVPAADAERLVDALAAAGAGALGAYDRCAWTAEGRGTFRPLPGATPAIGEVGRIEQVPETRVEMVVPADRRAAVIAALRAAHPYEEPAFDLLAQVPMPGRRGLGRIGELAQPMTVRQFAAHASARLPATAVGVRAAGDPDRLVRRVAVAGGACGSLVEVARRAGADAFLTADLKHHHVLEAVTEHPDQPMALLDAGHYATEAPWLDAVAGRLRERFGTTVEVQVSRRVTDPWTVHAPSEESSQSYP
jgi:dinuclear metal center YbgI/SA1388 family protein